MKFSTLIYSAPFVDVVRSNAFGKILDIERWCRANFDKAGAAYEELIALHGIHGPHLADKKMGYVPDFKGVV